MRKEKSLFAASINGRRIAQILGSAKIFYRHPLTPGEFTGFAASFGEATVSRSSPALQLAPVELT